MLEYNVICKVQASYGQFSFGLKDPPIIMYVCSGYPGITIFFLLYSLMQTSPFLFPLSAASFMLVINTSIYYIS